MDPDDDGNRARERRAASGERGDPFRVISFLSFFLSSFSFFLQSAPVYPAANYANDGHRSSSSPPHLRGGSGVTLEASYVGPIGPSSPSRLLRRAVRSIRFKYLTVSMYDRHRLVISPRDKPAPGFLRHDTPWRVSLAACIKMQMNSVTAASVATSIPRGTVQRNRGAPERHPRFRMHEASRA